MDFAVSLGLSILLILAVSSLFTKSFVQLKGVETQVSLQTLKTNILVAIENKESFNRTILNAANAAAFACINNGTDCTGQTGDITIVSYNPTTGIETVLPATAPGATNGFDINGQPCNTFDAANGNDACPFKYETKWTARCEANKNIGGAASAEGRCFNPTIEISVNFLMKPARTADFNEIYPNKYSIKLLKSQVKSNVNVQCGQVAGAFLMGDTCVLPTLGGAGSTCVGFCPGAQALVTGFNTNGTPRCTCIAAAVDRSCNTVANPIGRVLLGVNPDGSLICGDGLLPRLIANGSIFNPAGPPPAGY